MKKLIPALILILALSQPGMASGMQVTVGPYTFDADGCFSYNYTGADMVFVDYHYAGIALQYITYDELGASYDELIAAYTSGNPDTMDWELGYVLVDFLYNPSPDSMLQTVDVENPDPCIYPACALINGPMNPDHYSGICSAAIMVTSDGVLFMECIVYDTMVADDSTELRQGAFNRLMYNGSSVVQDEPVPGAPSQIFTDGKDGRTGFTIGDGYALSADGYIRYTVYDDYGLFFDYGYSTLTVLYYDLEDSAITIPASDAFTQAEKEKMCLEYFYDIYIIDTEYYAECHMEDAGFAPGTPLLIYGRNHDEYGGEFVGALILDGTRLLHIDITDHSGTSVDDLRYFRARILESITIDGKNIKLSE